MQGRQYAPTEDLEEATFGDRYVVCPVCQARRFMESDADGPFDCEECDAELYCKDTIVELTEIELGVTERSIHDKAQE